MKRTVAVLTLCLFVPGCDSSLGIVDFCNQQYKVQCAHWYTCHTPNVPFGSQAACEDYYAGVCKTSTECQGGFTYHPDAASHCVAAYLSQSCDEVNQSVTPSVCESVCTLP
jgi:hypothetical protein